LKKADYTVDVLLDVLGSYRRMIERSGGEFPTVVLSDIKASVTGILKTCEYKGKYADKEC
jgi:hypothetical protein